MNVEERKKVYLLRDAFDQFLYFSLPVQDGGLNGTVEVRNLAEKLKEVLQPEYLKIFCEELQK